MLETLPPKRAALRDRVIDIAEQKAEIGGISALRARDLANEAGCALGSIYTLFGDLGDVADAVNHRTLDQVFAALQHQATHGGSRPLDVLRAMAVAYGDYAAQHTQRWKMVFDTGLTPDTAAQAIDPIVDQFTAAMAAQLPAYSTRMVNRAARTLVAAIHGVVAMSLDPRMPVLSASDLKRNLTATVSAMVVTSEHV